nr:hypothetical protein GCM10023233_18300 [Brevibacterium otitidis]
MDNIDPELTENPDTIGLRGRFDQAGEHELEERFIVNSIETQPGIHGPDRVNQDP